MMKAKIGNAVVLGLSRENINKLMAGQPIKFNMRELNNTVPVAGEPRLPEMEVLIFVAKDESKMLDIFYKYIDKDTEFK